LECGSLFTLLVPNFEGSFEGLPLFLPLKSHYIDSGDLGKR
jgi:hypothetical protein